MTESVNVTIESQGEVDVVRFLADRLGGVEDIEDLSGRLTEQVERRAEPKLLVDFEGVSIVSSGLLGLLAALSVKTSKRGGRLGVCNLGDNIDVLFRRVKLDKMLGIYATRPEALAGLG